MSTIVGNIDIIIIKTKSILFLFQNTLQEHNLSHFDPEIRFQCITIQSLRLLQEKSLVSHVAFSFYPLRFPLSTKKRHTPLRSVPLVYPFSY
ncbi:hypothetical protein DJ87_5674 [Bacillus cereus]|nr:hypothetical protein DJ87_5674 [Bacillus cereus]